MQNIPSACRTCARNLGHYCMAMSGYDYPCFAHTENVTGVVADLIRMKQHLMETNNRVSAQDAGRLIRLVHEAAKIRETRGVCVG